MPDATENRRYFQTLIDRLSEKWTIPILTALARRPLRFNDVRRETGANSNVLVRSLRALERDRLVVRLAWPSGVLYVEYDLTPKGRRLLTLIDGLRRWTLQDRQPQQSPEPTAVDAPRTRPRGHPLRSRTGSEWVTLDSAPLMHASVAVGDIQRATRSFADIFRMALPSPMASQVTDGSAVGTILCCSFRLPNFFVEFVQQVDGTTPYGDFVRRHGDGIHHLAFHVPADELAPRLRWLERQGGRCVGGGPPFNYAAVDLRDRLGTTIEVIAPTRKGDDFCGGSGGPSAEANRSDAIGMQRVTHVGVLVRDIRTAADSYADIFGVEKPPIRTGSPRFPRSAKAARGAGAKVAMIGHRNIAIHLIEPVGASPLRDYLDEHNNVVHHVGFNLRHRLAPTLSALQAVGGRRLLGQPGDPYAHIDFRSHFGFILECTGSPSK